MPIANIIDNRKHKYRFLRINAIVEATHRDNHCKDADQMPRAVGDEGPDYEERAGVSLRAAIDWAMTFRQPVTLYLRDQESGI